jgi:hypothetical protein
MANDALTSAADVEDEPLGLKVVYEKPLFLKKEDAVFGKRCMPFSRPSNRPLRP